MSYLDLQSFKSYNDVTEDLYDRERFVEIDEMITPIIYLLNEKGYTTTFSCAGHSLWDLSIELMNDEIWEDYNMSPFINILESIAIQKIPSKRDIFAIFEVDTNRSLYISFKHEIGKMLYETYDLPSGFEWDDIDLPCDKDVKYTIRYYYKEKDFFKFTKEQLDVIERLFNWVKMLPDIKNKKEENKMKRVFVSVGMSGREAYDIGNDIERAKTTIKHNATGKVHIIDNYDCVKPDTLTTRLYCLGEAVKKLGDCDACFFVKGWENYNGCKVEMEVCKTYGIEIILEEELEKKELEKTVNFMNFGEAIDACKKGKKIARRNWNGKDQFVFRVSGTDLQYLDDKYYRKLGMKLGSVEYVSVFAIKTTSGQVQVGWLATQTDMMADDWYIVENN